MKKILNDLVTVLGGLSLAIIIFIALGALLLIASKMTRTASATAATPKIEEYNATIISMGAIEDQGVTQIIVEDDQTGKIIPLVIKYNAVETFDRRPIGTRSFILGTRIHIKTTQPTGTVFTTNEITSP